MLADLGSARDFLCRNRALLGPMSQPWIVSRLGVVKAERPCVATQQVCRDRVAQQASTNAQQCERQALSARCSVCDKDPRTTKSAWASATERLCLDRVD